jgi:hypothetical protein
MILPRDFEFSAFDQTDQNGFYLRNNEEEKPRTEVTVVTE